MSSAPPTPPHAPPHWHPHPHTHPHRVGRGRGPRKLHLQIFFALVLALGVAALASSWIGHWAQDGAPHGRPRRGAPRPVLVLAGFAALALLTWPVSRRITWRLERLSSSVQRFGQGDLSARAEVLGRDEVADLALRWNEAAERIEALVAQQRRVLSSASHELRAPLSRLRMAYELLLEPKEGADAVARAKLLAQVSADIEELDALVSEVLLDARMKDPAFSRAFEPLDLGALVREQCDKHGLEASLPESVSSQLNGDRRLLARLLRNLIENAQRHAGGVVEVRLVRDGEHLVLQVLDRGPGVPEAERARIFEPFYRPAGHSETRDGGVGLGLSLVADVARAHGGSARYLPRDGGGSVLEVRLPAASA